MARDCGPSPPASFQHDICRLNQLAEQVALFAAVWLSRTAQQSWLPDHAKDAYITYLARNYNRWPVTDLERQVRKLADRLDRQFSAPAKPFAAQSWVAATPHLNHLPALPNMAAERRFMRFLALRDLHEFIRAFAASPQQRHALRPWVQQALQAGIRQNQLENAWDNSITLWDGHDPPRPRTIVRARLQPGLWQTVSTRQH